MTLLRIILLALAIVVFAAVGWRVAETPDHRPRTSPVATNVPGGGPVVPEPSSPRIAPPETPSSPTSPPPPQQPATPAIPVPPTLPPAQPGATGASDAATMTAQARDTMEKRLRSTPDLARVFDAIAAAFPAAADRSLSEIAASLRAGRDPPSPDDFIATAMRDLRLTAGVLAARAGPDALAAIFEAKAAILADLEAADPRICADYLFGGTSPEFSDFVVAHRALVARSALATITAMTDGRTRQLNRDAPTADDYGQIEKGLAAKGLSAAEIAALLDGKSIDPPPSDTRLCDNMRAYLDVMRSMPQDARNRVYGFAAELLART